MINKFCIEGPWGDVIEYMGLNVRDVLNRAELPSDLFNQKHATLNTEEYFRLWHVIEEARGDNLFALEATALIFGDTFGDVLIAPIFAALCCRNFTQALHRLNDFKPLLGPMLLRLNQQPKQTIIYPDVLDVLHELPYSLALSELVFLTSLVRKGAGEHIVPLYITVPSQLENLNAYTDFFGIAPELGEKLCICFSQKDLERPFASSNETLLARFTAEFSQKISFLQAEAGFANQVRSVLLELLPAGVASSLSVANKLAVSKRTLQRRLQNENTSFQAELDQTRAGLAKYYLSQTSLPNQQIGFLLGFTDPNSFYRAFQGTVGTTPDTYRRIRQ